MASISADHFTRFSGYHAFLEAFEHEPTFTPGPLRPSGSTTPPVVAPIEPWIRDFFGYVSIDSVKALNLNSHPVTRMVINYMQGLEEATYPTDVWNPNSDGFFKTTLFPNFDRRLSPGQFTIDGLRTQPFKEGGVALTVKAFYNRSGFLHDSINVDKFDAGISALNNYFNANATALFAEYYRHAGHLIPSTSAVAQYTRLICSRAYRQLKAAELVTGDWKSPALEIFNHFVKLRALGAYDKDILFVWEQLTKGVPAISEVAIMPLSAASWKSYRGWLHAGFIDWNDMGAQNLARTTLRPEHNVRHVVIHAGPSICQFYMDHYGYMKSSSCFAGDTMVMLADGLSHRAIRNISVGDEVQASKFLSDGSSNCCRGKVAFVAQVLRDGRTLYELRQKPGILFTDTHPMIIRDKGVMPLLGFVNPNLAKSLNPTWQSIPTKRLESVKAYPATDADQEEVLYDLILEPNGDEQVHPSIYVLCNSSGQTLESASEAPLMEWFPYATCFFYSIMQEIKKGEPGLTEKLLQTCRNDIGLISALEMASKRAWEVFSDAQVPLGHCTNPKDIDIHTMFGHISPEECSLSATLIEILVGHLGRRINDCIETAWINESIVTKRQSVPYIVINTMTYRTVQLHPEYPMHEKLRFVITHNTVEIANQIVSADREGWMTFEIHHALKLDLSSISTTMDVRIDVFDNKSRPLFYGHGQIRENFTALICLAGIGLDDDEATLKLRLCKLDPGMVEEWQDLEKWNGDAKTSFAAIFGRCFNHGLLENMTKGTS